MFASILYATLTILLSLIAYFFYDQHKRFSVFQKLGIPGPKPHYLIGNAFKITLDALPTIKCLQEWQDLYGRIYGYYSGTIPALVVSDIDLLKLICIKDSEHFIDRLHLRPLRPVEENALQHLHGKRWKDVRRILSPIFSARKLKHLMPILRSNVQQLDNSLKKILDKSGDHDCDVYARLRRLTVDSIGECALAMKINCQRDEHSVFYDHLKGMSAPRNAKLISIWVCFPQLTKLLKYLLKENPIIKVTHFVFDNLRNVIEARRNLHHFSTTTDKMVDMLQLMLDATSEVNLSEKMMTDIKPLTNDEIVGNCYTFFFAGFETISITLAATTLMLATHPDIQDKVFEELMREVKDLSNVTYDDVNNLRYMKQVIKETLRLHPPAIMINRLCVRDYEYKGIKIPKGMRIDIPIYNIHHDAEFWSDPETFDPERFSPNNKANIDSASWLPFGLGPRNCIGIRFALLEIKLALVSMLSKYRLSLPTTQKLLPEQTFPTGTYIPSYGIYLTVEPRSCP